MTKLEDFWGFAVLLCLVGVCLCLGGCYGQKLGREEIRQKYRERDADERQRERERERRSLEVSTTQRPGTAVGVAVFGVQPVEQLTKPPRLSLENMWRVTAIKVNNRPMDNAESLTLWFNHLALFKPLNSRWHTRGLGLSRMVGKEWMDDVPCVIDHLKQTVVVDLGVGNGGEERWQWMFEDDNLCLYRYSAFDGTRTEVWCK